MRVIILFIFLIIRLEMSAQAPSRFCTTFGGGGIDIGYSMKEIYNRQYVIIGSTTSYGSGFPDAYLILADSMGQGIWQKNFGGELSDAGKSLIVNPSDSGFVFAGYSNSFGNGGYDIYVVRTDKKGDLIWQSTFGPTDWDFGNDIAFTADGNIAVCGNVSNGPYGKNDGIVAKLNIGNGTVMWSKVFGGSEDDEFIRISTTSDLKLTIVGNTKSYGDSNGDFWLFKSNNNGDSLTSLNFGNVNKKENCYDFMEDNNNKLVFCGSYDTSASNIGKNISYMIKTDLNGVFISEHKIGGAFTNEDKFLAITHNKQRDKYFLSRKVNQFGTEYAIDVQPYLMDVGYIFNNATTYGGIGEDVAYDVISTKDKGFAMVGYTKGYNLVSEDVFLIKLDSSIMNSPVIVGEPEFYKFKLQDEKVYYNEGILYFKNIQVENYTYQIINSQGQVVQKGSISKDNIELCQDLKADFYFLKVFGSKNLGLRFIKD
jgi:hypothetical protein